MIFMSLAFLTMLLAVNLSLSALQKDITTVQITDKAGSTLENVANSALQEVFATRFYPASNRLNWQFTDPASVVANSTPSQLRPVYQKSSFVMEGTQVVARYQYVVIGQQSARDTANLANYLDPLSATKPLATYAHLLNPEIDNVQQPMYVLVRAFGCLNKSTVQLDAGVMGISSAGQPTCNPSTHELKHYDLMANLLLIDETAATNAGFYQVDKIQRIELDDDVLGLGQKTIQLPTNVIVPNTVGVADTPTKGIQFTDFWPSTLTGSTLTKSMAIAERLLLEPTNPPTDPADSRLALKDISTGSGVGADYDTDPVGQLHLYFKGAMDTRSFFGYQYDLVTKDNIINPADVGILTVSLTEPSTGSLLGNATLNFNYPSADHVTISLDDTLDCGKSYDLGFPKNPADIRDTLRDSYGFPAPYLASVSIRCVP